MIHLRASRFGGQAHLRPPLRLVSDNRWAGGTAIAEQVAWIRAQGLRALAAERPSFENMERAVDAWRDFKRRFAGGET